MIYPWIWRHLPGKAGTRIVILVGIAVGIVAVLFAWVFPWLAPLLPFQQQTLGG
jgi:hypothetical protein